MILDNNSTVEQTPEELFKIANEAVNRQESNEGESEIEQTNQENLENNNENTAEVETQVEEPKAAEATDKEESVDEGEVSEEVRKENAFASISKKLSESKREATEAKAAKEVAEAQVNEYKERLAKAQGRTIEELDAEIEKLDSTESGISPEAQAQIDASKAKTKEIETELQTIKLGQGIQKLLDLGGEEKQILDFLANSESKYGVDLKSNPNITMIENFWKAENADNLIKSGIQKALNKEQSEITVVPGDTRANARSQKVEDPFLEKMLNIAKNEG